jgi:pimeloyl-ACP methyl ester carboxylesterase
VSSAPVFADQFAALLRDRDLLLVDQRGTGRSGALSCDLFATEPAATAVRDLFPAAAVERCARQLQMRADLTQYTFAQFANDIEQVRRALDYRPLKVRRLVRPRAPHRCTCVRIRKACGRRISPVLYRLTCRRR